ncbi:hydantoin racemase [Pseudomassariella vexata]|uniref:Hydantoin racemase n=1 Tax=Pseudomassariella vexata TaxID=1141098 RepID=A0A1Y2EBD4_9PEZI|nr:hydantoin racemase [Pseudomassariella vexata]ORY68889.1 hydantoin racemase [Pseudomassariella vexata]
MHQVTSSNRQQSCSLSSSTRDRHGMPTMSTKLVRGKRTKILVLNPNSSQSMTDGMQAVLDSVDLPQSTEIYTYTGPASSPASINDGDDIKQSTEAVLSDFETHNAFDGILVACFSVHDLVPKLQSIRALPKAVTGIFEASIITALSLLGPGQKWGIVTTGKFWEKHLSEGVIGFLGSEGGNSNSKFAGVESTGLNASDFHDGVDPSVVRDKLKSATKRLLAKNDVGCIVMGCAGMAGLEEIIRSAAAEVSGDVFAYDILHVVDGVRAGIMQVESMIKNNKLRRHWGS